MKRIASTLAIIVMLVSASSGWCGLSAKSEVYYTVDRYGNFHTYTVTPTPYGAAVWDNDSGDWSPVYRVKPQRNPLENQIPDPFSQEEDD